MDENKNLQNSQNISANNTNNSDVNKQEETKNQKKKTAADIVIEKLKAREENESPAADKINELKRLQEEVAQEAQPDTIEDDEEDDEEKVRNNELPNYNEYSREELTQKLSELLENDVHTIIEEVELIKNTFYKKRNAEIIEKRNVFVEEGGKKEDFVVEPDPIDDEFKKYYNIFRDKKREYSEKINAEKQRNLEQKIEIIKKIEALIEKGETLHKTFDEFHNLREEWNKIGSVPQNESKALLEKYNFTLQKFYDWVKINKELRDFDLKRNLDLKTKLCEEAEALIIEQKITKAYKKLQKLHEKWKEIGPVPKEYKEQIWERFKEASSIINKKHYDYFQQIQQQQKDNLKAKELLCEEAEKIAEGDYEKSSQWQQKSDEINMLMKLWRMIGFAPKKYNNSIFERFIAARKKFYEKKQKFYQEFTDILEKNLQEKEKLIIEAENAKDSTDWRRTTQFFVELQKKWTEIGPIPRAKKEEMWNRFNAACNHFFENKREYFKNQKIIEEENLKKKQALIEEIKNFEASDDPETNLKTIQDFQKKWSEIGYVPIKQKDKIYKEYKNAISEKLKSLNLDEEKQKSFDLRNKIDNILKSDNAHGKLRYEIERIRNKIDNVHNEIITLENNISFFVKSKNSEDIIKNFRKKIERLKERKVSYEKTLIEYIKAMKTLNKK